MTSVNLAVLIILMGLWALSPEIMKKILFFKFKYSWVDPVMSVLCWYLHLVPSFMLLKAAL